MSSESGVETDSISGAESVALRYLSADRLDRLRRANDSRREGFAVLLDIVGSTTRKHSERDWQLHTECLYEAFNSFCESLAKEIGCNEPVVKFVGDGLLAFFPSRQQGNQARPSAEQCVQFVDSALEFRAWVHDDLRDQLKLVRLKCVLAYLSNVAVIDTAGQRDVLGRGIDFLFRLEKFAGSAHLVLNESLASLAGWSRYAESRSSIEERDSRIVKCARNIRGWERKGPQTFYVVVRPEALREDPPGSGPGDDHITAELLGVMLAWQQERQTESVDKPSWALPSPKVEETK